MAGQFGARCINGRWRSRVNVRRIGGPVGLDDCEIGTVLAMSFDAAKKQRVGRELV
jgi:hypothetical protein